MNPEWLHPVYQRSQAAHNDLTMVKAREVMVKTRTEMINFVRATYSDRTPSGPMVCPSASMKRAPHSLQTGGCFWRWLSGGDSLRSGGGLRDTAQTTIAGVDPAAPGAQTAALFHGFTEWDMRVVDHERLLLHDHSSREWARQASEMWACGESFFIVFSTE